jgi:hypothetical protein
MSCEGGAIGDPDGTGRSFQPKTSAQQEAAGDPGPGCPRQRVDGVAFRNRDGRGPRFVARSAAEMLRQQGGREPATSMTWRHADRQQASRSVPGPAGTR